MDESAATFDREQGEPLPDFSVVPPVLVEHVSVRGTFLLLTPMHLLTTATLRDLQGKNPHGDRNRRRFRPDLGVGDAVFVA